MLNCSANESQHNLARQLHADDARTKAQHVHRRTPDGPNTYRGTGQREYLSFYLAAIHAPTPLPQSTLPRSALPFLDGLACNKA
ncbi:MAG: hypothetical protein U0559_09125 [Anaerolineae bacterium]